MANNFNVNENILVKADHNNLVYIDPNSVVDKDGFVAPRLVDHENLVMYVNLEADIIPRTTLYSDGEQNTLLSIAEGKLNFLKNANGDELNTSWSESFYPDPENSADTKHDKTAQTFGIENINIVTKGVNNLPDITINFIDVRGKTLFESPKNSPYQAFFHQPWPIFYLTIKGYYGKAVRYRLHLVDFKSKFNGSTGNYEITTKFLGSTFAYLNDILLQNMMVAPYMYMVETATPLKENTKTGLVEKTISKTTKGYQILKSVYNDYIRKGYLEENFPVKTLRELLMNANSAERMLESQIFENIISFEVLGAVKEYETLTVNFQKAIDAWGRKFLDYKRPLNFLNDERTYYPLTKEANDGETTTTTVPTTNTIKGPSKEALYTVIDGYRDNAYKNNAFGDEITVKDKDLKLNKISFEKLYQKNYVSTADGTISVAIEDLRTDIDEIRAEFEAQRNSLEEAMEKKMNNIIQNDKTLGLGFKPSIRNIFAVICANAEAYIRLMKDVHYKAVQYAKERKELINAKLAPEYKDEGLYPWPQIKKKLADNSYTLIYPGDKTMIQSLKSNNYTYWPEVEFVENYEAVATKRSDGLNGEELDINKLQYIFPNEPDNRLVNSLSTGLNVINNLPYADKTISNLIYEIYERAFYSTSYDSFSINALNVLRDKEFETIQNTLSDDTDLKQIIKTIALSGITTYEEVILKTYSPFERHPYYMDRQATVDYIKEIVDRDFSIEEFTKAKKARYTINGYDAFVDEIKKYDPLDYRYDIYPFNSTTYKTYLGRNIKKEDFVFRNILNVNENDSFISSPLNPKMWIKDGFDETTFFKNKIELIDYNANKTYRNILNTPYFHKQLYNDFFKGGHDGRYTGAAYLLLNSLPFKDLDDTITVNNDNKILMSSLFREIGSTHFIPYHLALKWGSQYHRYKKYILDGVDIISGATTPINSVEFFNASTGATFTHGTYNTYVSGSTIYSTGTTQSYPVKTTGLYPYYQDIYYQVINGYVYFVPGDTSGTVRSLNNNETDGDITITPSGMRNNFNTAFSDAIIKEGIKLPYMSDGFMCSYYIDNKSITSTDTFSLLPSNGDNQVKDLDFDYTVITQDSFRVLWESESEDYPNYASLSMPSYGERFALVSGNTFSLNGTKRKVVDLIATFSPLMLDEFEQMFLEFSNLKIKTDANTTTNNFLYNNFQDLLKDISTVRKSKVSENNIGTFVAEQNNALIEISKAILKNENTLKVTIGNPKQIDNYTLYGVAKLSTNYNDGSYFTPQLTQQNLGYIKLYIGEDIQNYYRDYFRINNVELNDENIYRHRELARIYAGWVTKSLAQNGSFVPTRDLFIEYITNNIIIPHQTRYNHLFDTLLRKMAKDLDDGPPTPAMTIYSGFNTEKTTKLDTYHFFKAFNDKWVGGNSLGQRHLIEDFLFLDRANKDIGDELFLSLEKLKMLGDKKNLKKSFYAVISMLISGDNIDFRPLPAYVNYYGTNYNDTKRIMPSKTVARNLFGTFLEVDYQDSTPKMILQYIGPQSKYLKMKDVSKKNKYPDDGMHIGNTVKNPLLLSQQLFMNTDFSRSNRVVGFEVNFGDQAQNMFKSVQLDQSSKTPTSETFLAYEALGRSDTGSNIAQIDVNLFDLYRTYSYTCDVTMLGDVMIQPTMYFYLNNIPMFEGTYYITEVQHSIRAGQIETSFKGARIPNDNLPKVSDSFVAAYRPLFDKILNAAFKKKQQASNTTTTSKTIVINNVNVDIDLGPKNIPNENVITASGFIKGVPYNGQNSEKYIQYVELNGEKWLRARVVQMGNPSTYDIDDDTQMTVISSSTGKIIKWMDIKEKVMKYYSTRFDFGNTSASNLTNMSTTFFNPSAPKSTDSGTENPFTLNSKVDLNTGTYEGPIHNGLPSTTYGIALSGQLMRRLKVNDGDVIYFRPNE